MQSSKKRIVLPLESCVGCSACMAICPKQCISMQPDNKGFLRPVIDSGICISCKSCLRICQAEGKHTKTLPSTVLAARIIDNGVLSNSSSGGIAWILSKHILQQGGAVYGAAFDENMTVKHIRVENESELYRLQGSKYVQSDITNIYALIKQDLSNGIQVLFIGTPCQVAAIKKVFLNTGKQLLTCDLICHGVPSPRLFADHIRAIETSFSKKVADYRFRDKVFGWNYNINRIIFKDGGSSIHSYWTQCYKRLFFSNYGLRDSCYICKYSSLSRQGDITLGDYWGINQVSDIFKDNKGVSVVFANTSEAKKLMDIIKGHCTYIETSLSKALQMQLIMPVQRPKRIDAFWNTYYKTSYKETCYKFAGKRIFLTIRNLIKDLIVKYKLIHI
ncbi:Coenzyme F420 hydrogenase/dehydrogenase, beta subunit C-terminal domain [Bacteroides sp. AN502(2024)]|uniref:Coenzyme F420 hydrogenase/dehydrogenase, beta subunit C-terminal domain n=1 Tax=Bacteroides sp. AN502(2024) TaxID=3160599 RepID=UPI0035179764